VAVAFEAISVVSVAVAAVAGVAAQDGSCTRATGSGERAGDAAETLSSNPVH
jgi:hypothetical protein